MLVSGGDDVLGNLQNVIITVTAAFLIVVILLMFAIIEDLRKDVVYLDYRSQQEFAARLVRERRIHGVPRVPGGDRMVPLAPTRGAVPRPRSTNVMKPLWKPGTCPMCWSHQGHEMSLTEVFPGGV